MVPHPKPSPHVPIPAAGAAPYKFPVLSANRDPFGAAPSAPPVNVYRIFSLTVANDEAARTPTKSRYLDDFRKVNATIFTTILRNTSSNAVNIPRNTDPLLVLGQEKEVSAGFGWERIYARRR